MPMISPVHRTVKLTRTPAQPEVTLVQTATPKPVADQVNYAYRQAAGGAPPNWSPEWPAYIERLVGFGDDLS